MTPAQRCDEIIRLIDEVLRADVSPEPVTRRNHSQDPWLERRFVLARPENRH
ncbi:MAG TPA: hypothetical protein VK283_09975 [Acidimicrobiales bacterium]|nr:hypothetical protein [Acidimicrobiales bacterium]